MKSKTQTPLGFLMELAGVRLRDLSDYLYVAQASVSKWKTGARALSANSTHLAGIVEYFVALSKDDVRGARLSAFLSKWNPGEALDSPEALSKALFLFLTEKHLPDSASRELSVSEGRLYRAEFSVYAGPEGRDKAFAQLCTATQSHPVRMLACEAFPAERLLPMADAGIPIKLLLDRSLLPCAAGSLAPLIAHIKVDTRLLPASALEAGALRAVREGMLLLGSAARGEPCYTALFTDACTVRQHEKSHAAIWEAAQAPFARCSPDEMRPKVLGELLQGTVEERIDLFLPSLPLLTMRRELLMEVLAMNGVSGLGWSRALGCHASLQRARIRLFLPHSALGSAAVKASALCSLTGRAVRLTETQARRHLLDTAALLRAEALEMCVLQGEYALGGSRTGMFCRRNGFAGLLDTEAEGIRLSRMGEVIDAFMAAFDASEHQIPSQLRDGGYLAGILERVALTS